MYFCGFFFNTENTEFFISQSYTENIREIFNHSGHSEICYKDLFVAFVPPVCRQAGSWRNKLRSNKSVVIRVLLWPFSTRRTKRNLPKSFFRGFRGTCLPTGRSVAKKLRQQSFCGQKKYEISTPLCTPL